MVAEQTKQILSECGIPQRVISDNGIQFTGEAYQRFVCTWKIEHVTKSAGYPMSNEILERAIRTVKYTLDKARETGIYPYLAMLSIRATPIADKLPSPAKFYLDRQARTRHPHTHGDQIIVKTPITSTSDRPCVVSGNDIQEIYRRHLGPRSFEARNIPIPPYHMAIKHGEPEVEETRTKFGRISKPSVRYNAWRVHDRYMNS